MFKDLMTAAQRLAPSDDKLAAARRYLQKRRISATCTKHHFKYLKAEHGSRLLTEHRNAGIRAAS